MAEREESVYQAKLAEQAERYDEMVESMKKVAKQGTDLSVEERNLLSVAYKNVVGAKRASWRTLAGGFDDADEELLKKYKAIVEDELEAICNEVLALLTDHLCKNVKGNGDETEVFYLKMCGDYYRYLSEFKTEPEDKAKDIKANAEKFYKEAMDVAEANLNETHPTRLGLALNRSVCYYEIQKESQTACNVAKKAFDDAIQKLDTLNDDTYKDSTLIMQLLRDNLTLWTSENQDNVEEQED